MTRSRLIVIVFLISLSDWCFSQYVSNIELLRKIVSESGQAEVAIPEPGRQELDKISQSFSISSVRNDEVRIKLSPFDIDRFIDLRFEFRIIERPGAKGIISRQPLEKVMEW